MTGKIDGLTHDHFGDFCGFILETEWARRHYYETRERHVREIVADAARERTRVTVFSARCEPNVPLAVILRHGGR